MYNTRFQNYRPTKLFQINGKVSLIHVGAGNFIYTMPGRNRTYVGKIELGRKKYRLKGAGIGIAIVLFVSVLIFFNMNTSEASVQAAESLTSLSTDKESIEFEEKTEQWKNKILSSEAKGNSSGNEAADVNGGIRIHEYTVRSGDTLSGVARRFRVGADLIAASSGIKTGEALHPGHVLQIPSKPGLIYTVKPGESLASIALKYSTTADKIRQDNPDMADLDLVEPGSVVFLPDARIPKPPSIWSRPAAGRITSAFGWRRHPIFGHRQMHSGIDIGVYYSPVKAARDGEVTYASRLGAYGNTVVVKHENGFQTLYAHLSRITVKNGQRVKAGSVIAVSGNTGMSTGPHLHFEVIQNGRAVNPARFVKF